MMVGITTMLAMKTNIDEFYVSPEETDQFLKAAQNVARHYSVETTQKTLDWIAFIGCGAQVFGTRAVAISVKMKTNRQSSPAAPGATVHQFSPVIVPDATGVSDSAS